MKLMKAVTVLTILITVTTAVIPLHENVESKPPRWPLPRWPPRWQLNLSTVTASEFPDGFYPPSGQIWGLTCLDWSNGNAKWFNGDPLKSTSEETNIQNAMAIKQVHPESRVWLYRNFLLALEFLTTNRVHMYDPTKSHWFLQYTDGNGHKNGTIYNEPISFGDQYFWDHRLPEVRRAFIDAALELSNNQWVDGFFTDDCQGTFEEHKSAVQKMNLTTQDLFEINQGTKRLTEELIMALDRVGKYDWQAFGFNEYPGPAPNSTTCLDFMRDYCSEGKFFGRSMTMDCDITIKSQVTAAFLISRPAYGWLNIPPTWDPFFDLDVGVPQGSCVEGPVGVFSRKWSKMTVTLDCNTWTSSPF